MTCSDCGKTTNSVWPLHDLKLDAGREPRVCDECYRRLRNWAPHPAMEEQA